MSKIEPSRAIRLLRAKAAELESQVHSQAADGLKKTDFLRADIALIAQILADFMERMEARTELDRLREPFAGGVLEGRPSEARSLGGYRDPELER